MNGKDFTKEIIEAFAEAVPRKKRSLLKRFKRNFTETNKSMC